MKHTKIIIMVALLLVIGLLSAEKSKERIAQEFALSADSLFLVKDYASAIPLYEQSLAAYKEAITDVTPFDDDIKTITFKLYQSGTNGKVYDKAVYYGELSLQKDSTNFSLAKNISLIYRLGLKNNDKSISVLLGFEKNNPTYEVRALIADTYDKIKDYKNSVEWYQKAYDQSKNTDLLEKIADLHVKLNNNASAIKVYEDYLATELTNDDKVKAYINLGTLYNKLKNTNKAIEYYEKANEIKSDSKIALFLASEYYGKKDYLNTIKYASVVLEADASNADAIYLRASSYYNTNKKDLAKADFNKIEKNAKYGKSATDFIKLIDQGK